MEHREKDMNDPDYIRIGVGVFITDERGRIVFGRRIGAHGADRWSIPGGKPEPYETLDQTARREGNEETGLKLGRAYFIATTDDPMPEESMHWLTHFFVAGVTGGELAVTEPGKYVDVRWIDPAELPNYSLFSPLANFLRSYGVDAISHGL